VVLRLRRGGLLDRGGALQPHEKWLRRPRREVGARAHRRPRGGSVGCGRERRGALRDAGTNQGVPSPLHHHLLRAQAAGGARARAHHRAAAPPLRRRPAAAAGRGGGRAATRACAPAQRWLVPPVLAAVAQPPAVDRAHPRRRAQAERGAGWAGRGGEQQPPQRLAPALARDVHADALRRVPIRR
jgi:hypothetical protein